MSFRPGIDLRGQSFRHPYCTDGIAARPRIGRVERRFPGEVGHVLKSASRRANPLECLFSRLFIPGNLILINDHEGTSCRQPWVMPAGLIPPVSERLAALGCGDGLPQATFSSGREPEATRTLARR